MYLSLLFYLEISYTILFVRSVVMRFLGGGGDVEYFLMPCLVMPQCVMLFLHALREYWILVWYLCLFPRNSFPSEFYFMFIPSVSVSVCICVTLHSFISTSCIHSIHAQFSIIFQYFYRLSCQSLNLFITPCAIPCNRWQSYHLILFYDPFTQ